MIRLLMGFIATVCFAIVYNVPKRALLPAGLVGTGALGILMGATYFHMSSVAGAFFAALFVSVFSEILARIQKLPGTVFTVSGVLTLVPGMSSLNAMRSFVVGDYMQGISYATETFLIAGAVAAGLVLAGALVRMDRRKQRAVQSEAND